MKPANLVWTLLLLVAGIYVAYRAATSGMGTLYVRDVDNIAVAADAWEYEAGTARVSVPRTIGLWIAAAFTFCILSFLYRDNAFYKTAESIFIGVSAAYWMVVGFWSTVIPNLVGKLIPALVARSGVMPDLSPVHEDYWFTYFLPLVLGGLLLWRLVPKGGWISRWPLAFIIGTFAGLRLVGFMQADFLVQIRSSVVPLVVMTNGEFDFWGSLRSLTILAGILACLVYFFFSFEHKGVVDKISRFGIWFLMVTFGAAFGYTVMGRIALLAARLEFLFDDWLWLIDPKGLRPPSW